MPSVFYACPSNMLSIKHLSFFIMSVSDIVLLES